MKLFKDLEKFLAEYRLVIGIVIIILLATLCIMTYINFDKQNQIIEKGGYTDGKIKCVCTQSAWEEFEGYDNLNFSEIENYNG